MAKSRRMDETCDSHSDEIRTIYNSTDSRFDP